MFVFEKTEGNSPAVFKKNVFAKIPKTPVGKINEYILKHSLDDCQSPIKGKSKALFNNVP